MPVASCEVKQFGSTRALVVERFDRMLHPSGRYWLRLPQEDFCQATGTPGSGKYEAEGGPGLPDLARLLQVSTRREDDLAALLRARLLFWMLAATDGHAKNFSIRMLAEGRYHLAPLYDVISAGPITGAGQNQLHFRKLKLAIAVRGTRKHYRLAEIERRHFNATARQCGFGADMEDIMTDVVARTPGVIATVEQRLPRRFPAEVFESVTGGLRKAAAALERMPAK
jgi:serine/threonine-protein kinase HipA